MKTPLPVVEALNRVYAQIYNVDCKGLCYGACSGLVAGTPTEMARMREYAAETRFALRTGDPYRCPYLTDSNRCAVYPVRPLICRTWGVADDQKCPHGCKPKHPLTQLDGVRLVRETYEATGVPFAGLDTVLELTDGTVGTIRDVARIIEAARGIKGGQAPSPVA